MKRLLVANRSEIACRVFQACRELGIETVALLAPGDEDARHVTYADQVERVPSYLDIEAICQAIRKSGATLVHPGYGFLSERAPFVEAVEKMGVSFLGPRAESMRAMGGKVEAKLIAEKAKVPTLPWAKLDLKGDTKADEECLKRAAAQIGYPLLLKAAAGGGGKGMRKVHEESELSEALEGAQSEAVSSFGDGTVFLEKLLVHPRHIEVQVFGDGKGGGIHLFERECSLQRRHQKVWEEAPAPDLPEATRKGLHLASLSLVREVKYRSAGTLEFLVDKNGGFYFLEMNTRLQVEHPVTEEVTGLDLVHLQIEQALKTDSFLLPKQESIFPRGHSIEVRIYAEDPAQGFMPTPGPVWRVKWPTGAGIRVESGIEEGQVLGTKFDPMIGKLITRAETRLKAIERMKFALEETVILGLGTNQSYLHALTQDDQVREGRVHTHFLEEAYASFKPPLPDLTPILQVSEKSIRVPAPWSGSFL